MNYTDLMQQLTDVHNLQPYGLTEGFEKWEQKTGSCLDVIWHEPFEWVHKDGHPVTVYISVTHKVIAVDEEDEPCEWEKEYEIN
jgi:hypothetical protein